MISLLPKAARWITVHGTHVQVDDAGKVKEGPKNLTGKPINNLPKSKPTAKPAKSEKLPEDSPSEKPTFTPQETAAVNDYTGGIAFRINGNLRSGAPLTGQMKEVDEGLQKAFAKVPVGEPQTVFRGIQVGGAGADDFARQAKEAMDSGKPLHNAGYMSTTKNEADMAGTPVSMKIVTPQGLDVSGISKNTEEQEVLINRGSDLKINKVERRPDGGWHIEAEHIPGKKAVASLRKSPIYRQKSKDASGHEHSSETGQFTSGSGGNSKASAHETVDQAAKEMSKQDFATWAREKHGVYVYGSKNDMVKQVKQKLEGSTTKPVNKLSQAVENPKKESVEVTKPTPDPKHVEAVNRQIAALSEYQPHGVSLATVYENARSKDPSLTVEKFKDTVLGMEKSGQIELSAQNKIGQKARATDTAVLPKRGSEPLAYVVASKSAVYRQKSKDASGHEHSASVSGKPANNLPKSQGPAEQKSVCLISKTAVWRGILIKGDKGRWITIGGKKGEGGKRSGGSPVYVENGRITRGAPSLAGRKIAALKEKPEARPELTGNKRQQAGQKAGQQRQENESARGYSRAKWGKQAKEQGHKAQHLHQLAAEFMAHDKAHKDDVTSMLQHVRKTHPHMRALTAQGAFGRIDASNVKMLDDIADELSHSKQWGHVFPKDADPEHHLFDLLSAGNPEHMSEDEAYESALEELNRSKASEANYQTDDEEPIPF